jgi:hypothetical protein
MKTAFDRMLEEKRRDPEWAAGYERALARVNQTHRVLQTLDEARETRGLSKAELGYTVSLTPSDGHGRQPLSQHATRS